MKLYKIEASNCETFFGTSENPIARDVTIIAQTPSCDAFLLLSKDAQDGLEHEILELKAEILEAKSHQATEKEAFELNRKEITILEKLLEELYVIAEPTRIPGYSDEEMWEANQANEFTVNIGREIQAEMIANGRPSPAKLKNAMSNPYTWNALKDIGLVPKETKILVGNVNPSDKIKLIGVEDEVI